MRLQAFLTLTFSLNSERKYLQMINRVGRSPIGSHITACECESAAIYTGHICDVFIIFPLTYIIESIDRNAI